MRWTFLILSSFLASAVEMVEALTIVLATGVTRGWRSALLGVGAAAPALGALFAILGPAVDNLLPPGGPRPGGRTLPRALGPPLLRQALPRPCRPQAPPHPGP